MIKRCCICTGAFETKSKSSPRTRTCSTACGEKLSYITHRKARMRWAERHPGRKQRFNREYTERNHEQIKQRARENARKRRRAAGIKPRQPRQPRQPKPPKQKHYQYSHCVMCNQEIDHAQRRGQTKTCSPTCSEALYQAVLAKGRAERARRRICICVGCKRAFTPPHRLGTKYCSKKCQKDVTRADPIRREKQRLRSWCQLRRRGAPIRPPVMSSEERRERKRVLAENHRRKRGIKPQKRLTEEERLERYKQKLAKHLIWQNWKYANDPNFKAKRRAEALEYRFRMKAADPTWVAKETASRRERENRLTPNPTGERQWLERNQAELRAIRRILKEPVPPKPKVSQSPSAGSTPDSSSPL